jgi:predicted nucleic acid-binding protein
VASRAFVDASVVLEILLQRAQASVCVARLSNPQTSYYISTLTVHLAYYFGEKLHLDPTNVEALVAIFGLLSIDARTVKLAQVRYQNRDFEDCLQAASAEIGDCQQIITLDKKFADHSGTPLKVIVPAP